MDVMAGLWKRVQMGTRWGLTWIFSVVLAEVGCGYRSTPAPCGPGTVAADDHCVGVDAGADGDADADVDADTDADGDADADCAGGPTAWTIARAGDRDGLVPLIAMDSKGHLHVSHVSPETLKMRYATNASGDWVAEDVDLQATHVWDHSLVVYDDIPHVTYSLARNGSVPVLMYARREADGWRGEVVDAGGGTQADLMFDADGNVHLVYLRVESSLPHLIYATNASGDWVDIDLLVESVVASAVMDDEGHVHIVVQPWDLGEIVYITDASGVMEQTTLGDGCLVPRIALQDGGDLRLVCVLGATGVFQFWTNEGDGWELDDSWGHDGGWADDLVAVPDGSLRMAYTRLHEDGSYGGLQYVMGVPGAFVAEPLHEDGSSGSMTRSAAGHVHIVYWTQKDGMFYAERCE
jgi:hypothetical protein